MGSVNGVTLFKSANGEIWMKVEPPKGKGGAICLSMIATPVTRQAFVAWAKHEMGEPDDQHPDPAK